MARLELISRDQRSGGGTPPGQPARRRRYPLHMLALLSALFLAAPDLRAAQPPVNLVQLAELTPSQRANQDWFGFSIAVSGNTVVVGAFDANIEQYGAVYVYVKPPSGWADMTEVAKLTSSDNGQGFGTSVAISGDTIVVGAANTSNLDAPAAGPGAAYVFVRPAGGWTDMTETAKLTASDGEPGDAFGVSVSISGNTIAVGAFFAQDASGNDFAGKAYVFVRPGTGWGGNLHETAKLTASDSQLLNYMGASIATNGTAVVAGSYGHNNFQGVGYVFVRPPGGWTNMTQTAELTASNGKPSTLLGLSAAISGNTIVLGAPGAGNLRGAGYVYVKPASGWGNMTETAQLRVATSAQGDDLGRSVSISGNVAVLGAPVAVVNGNYAQGAAFVFGKPRTGWKTTSRANAVLTASDGGANDSFGLSAGISGSTIVAGAIGNNEPGAAYVFGP